MQAGDWTQYTLDVRVAQTYMVEVRAEAIGTNTGGVFQCDFTNGVGVLTNSAGISNSTGPLTNISTTWTNVSKVIYLTNGIYAMKLHCLNNATNSTNVGRFNYISVYPYWNPPVIPTNIVDVTGLSSISNYATASNNAVLIQSAVNSLGSVGGTVFITNNGSYYVVQAFPDETNNAYNNSAVSITNSNVEIRGNGKTNTVLVGYNRATTFFSLGASPGPNFYQCTDFVLRDMTLQARPNWAVSGITNSTNIIYDTNQLVYGSPNDQSTNNLTNGFETGTHVILWGLNSSSYSYNLLITNCEFLDGYDQIEAHNTYVSNVLVQGCDFLWTGSTVFFGNVGFFGQGFNFVVISNTFDGNTNLAPASFAEISTNLYYNGVIAGVGLVWFQIYGNWFVGGNIILNNLFEGVQVNNGPSSIVGNTYSNLTSNGSGCALDAYGGYTNGPTEKTIDNATCFVGNSVYGGRQGVEASDGFVAYTLNCSGNSFTLYPAYDEAGEWPGSAVQVQDCQSANVCGNTLTNGGYGFGFSGGCSNALILNNNFSGATYRGIGYGPAGGYLNTAQIFGNTLCEGVSFHIQLTYTNSFGWFLGQNTNVNANLSIIPLFTDPASSAVHIFN